MFDLYCRDRTYHLQAESEAEAKRCSSKFYFSVYILLIFDRLMIGEFFSDLIFFVLRWVIALKQEIVRLKAELLNAGNDIGETNVVGGSNREWGEWKKCVLAVRNLPGNRECADCSSTEGIFHS